MTLKEWRKKNRYTSEEIASLLNIHVVTLYRLTKRPSKMFILAIENITNKQVRKKDWKNAN
jgi:transcriptional regulator with XRE-family HTH domain